MKKQQILGYVVIILSILTFLLNWNFFASAPGDPFRHAYGIGLTLWEMTLFPLLILLIIGIFLVIPDKRK